ncbi:MAG TPA: hypothetical protein DCP90_09460 [Clostridiales bacterium]|nr:MAG: hypothetical protein A2Y22_04800 [Clostridiales bacterium GWD2_32_59]HAN10819.1 hypothetical protein [Clostridiales bacterium]
MQKEYILYIFLILTPFLEGLYFEYSFCISNVFLLIYLIYLVLKNKKLYYSKNVDFFVLLSIVVIYIFSYAVAIDKGMNVYGIIKALEPFLFYMVLLQLDVNNKEFVRVITISAVILVILSILALYQNVFADIVIENNRLGGFFGYANTYALYMLMAFIIMQEVKLNIYVKVLTSALILATLMLTYSRSVIIIGSIVIIYIFIKENNTIRKSLVISTFLTFVLYLIIVKTSFLHGESSRLSQISMQSTELQARFLYYYDALGIILKNIWGLGYDGYYYIEGAYQTGIYKVRLVHNSILQVALEIGIIGVIAYLVMGINSILKRIKRLKHENFDYLDLALIIILAHSLFDFDLSFGVLINIIVMIIYLKNRSSSDKDCFLLLGSDIGRDNLFFKTTKAGILVIVSCIVLIMVNIFLGVSAVAMHTGEYDLAISCYAFNTEAYVKKADHYMQLGDIEKAKEYIVYAKNLNSRNIDILKIERDIKIFDGELKEALKIQESIVELDRINIIEIEKYSNLLLEIIKKESYNKEKEIYKEKMKNIREYIYKANASISELAYKQKRVPVFLMTKTLLENEEDALKH